MNILIIRYDNDYMIKEREVVSDVKDLEDEMFLKGNKGSFGIELDGVFEVYCCEGSEGYNILKDLNVGDSLDSDSECYNYLNMLFDYIMDDECWEDDDGDDGDDGDIS